MPHTFRTIALNERWDISLLDSGKIPVYYSKISVAQNVANEIRRFTRDTYFDYNVGVPHFEIELGHILPESLLRAAIREATLRVEQVNEILDINVDDFNRETRLLTGSVTFTTIDDETLNINF